VKLSQGAVPFETPIVWVPSELKAALELKQEFGSSAHFISGGTLLQTYWEKGMPLPRHLISLEGIKALEGFGDELLDGEKVLHIGALTTLDQFRQHPYFLSRMPLLAQAAGSIAAPAVRSRATIGGNVANGSGDTIPALLAMDAALVLYDGMETQRKSLWSSIEQGNFLSDAILTAVEIPSQIVDRGGLHFYKKMGRRESFSPSVVTIAGSILLNAKREIEFIRLAAGGGSILPQRLTACEELAEGCPFSSKLSEALHKAIQNEFTPSSDDFFTADYKKMVTANLMISEIARLAG